MLDFSLAILGNHEIDMEGRLELDTKQVGTLN